MTANPREQTQPKKKKTERKKEAFPRFVYISTCLFSVGFSTAVDESLAHHVIVVVVIVARVASLFFPTDTISHSTRESIDKNTTKMSGRQGGKLKPLKQKKKQNQDLDPEDIAFKQKQKADAAAKKAMMANIKAGKPLVGGGIKKSGKK